MKNLSKNSYFFGIILFILIFSCNNKTITNALDSQTNQENMSSKIDFFDTDGSYYLEKDITIGETKLHSFAILDGISYYNNGKLDYNNPVIKEPKVYIYMFTKNNKQNAYSCKNTIITRQKLFLKTEQTLIGDVTIEGEFLDERGQFWNHSVEGKAIVQAKVSIIKNRKNLYSATKLFKYWSGD